MFVGSGKKKKKSDPMKRISTKKQGVKKALQKIKKQEEAARQLKLKKKRVRTAAGICYYINPFTRKNIIYTMQSYPNSTKVFF